MNQFLAVVLLTRVTTSAKAVAVSLKKQWFCTRMPISQVLEVRRRYIRDFNKNDVTTIAEFNIKIRTEYP